MKRFGLILLGIIIIILGGFFWLVSQAGPQHAPNDVVTTPLPDTFER